MSCKIPELVSAVIDKLKIQQSPRLFTVAISGIDAAGKGYISKCVQEALLEKGYIVALINIDPWQNPLPIRLQKDNAAFLSPLLSFPKCCEFPNISGK